jgi:hypothetical protein
MGYQVVVPKFDILETNGLLEVWQAGPGGPSGSGSRCRFLLARVHPIGLSGWLSLLGHLMDLIRDEEKKETELGFEAKMKYTRKLCQDLVFL